MSKEQLLQEFAEAYERLPLRSNDDLIVLGKERLAGHPQEGCLSLLVNLNTN